MSQFVYGGPPRYRHQVMALKKMIATGGVGALLMEPGTGKTAVTLDFASVLALKQPSVDGVQETRVLVIAPLAAVDTWVQQSKVWVSPSINVWAEAIGGSILQRAETLAARGGQPFVKWNPDKPSKWLSAVQVQIDDGDSFREGWRIACTKCSGWAREVIGQTLAAKDRAFRDHLKDKHPEFELRMPLPRRLVNGIYVDTPERAEGWQRSWDWYARSSQRPHIIRSDGPDGLGTDKPRLIIEVINIDTLGSRAKVGSKLMSDVVLDGVRRYNPHLVVVDESHRIKGHTSNVSKLADRIGQLVPKRMILTGTVMPAGPMDVFSQWRFLDPYAFGDIDEDGVRRRATFQRFQSRFAVMGGYLGHQVVGYRNMDELQNIMGQRAAVVLKRDALDLPPVVEVVVPVMLSAAEKKAYMDMKKSLAYAFGGSVTGGGPVATVSNSLVQIMRLRQITAGHLPDDMGITREIGTSKVDTISSIVHDQLTGEKRIVVFTLFTHELEMLKRKLAKPGTIVETISGSTPQSERVAIRQRFGDKTNTDRIVLVAQIKTLSLAVNELVSASNVIFGSLSQQRDDLIQAIDRLNRIGQDGEKVTVWYAEAPGTIDGVIHQSHRDGTSLEQAVLDHVMQFNPDVDDLMAS